MPGGIYSRLRRAGATTGRYLLAYAREMAWREDNRRQTNGGLHGMAAGAALLHPVSRVWAGYWQRCILPAFNENIRLKKKIQIRNRNFEI